MFTERRCKTLVGFSESYYTFNSGVYVETPHAERVFYNFTEFGMLFEKSYKKIVARTLLSSFISFTSLYLRPFFPPLESVNHRVKRGSERNVTDITHGCFRSLGEEESKR